MREAVLTSLYRRPDVTHTESAGNLVVSLIATTFWGLAITFAAVGGKLGKMYLPTDMEYWLVLAERGPRPDLSTFGCKGL